jgi:hypothetical protein
MVCVGVVFSLQSSILLVRTAVTLEFLVRILIRKRYRNHNTRKVKQVDDRRVAVVPEVIVQHGGCRCDRCDDGVELLAHRFFHLSQFFEVFHLVLPLLQIDVPQGIHVDCFDVGVQEGFDIWDGRFARSIEFTADFLGEEVSFDLSGTQPASGVLPCSHPRRTSDWPFQRHNRACKASKALQCSHCQ